VTEEPAHGPQPDERPEDDPLHRDNLKRAMKAFRKRLKLARLNDESRLGGRYTSSGRKSSIDAIQPPHQYPREVWDELVRQGKLVYTGQGFFRLAEEA